MNQSTATILDGRTERTLKAGAASAQVLIPLQLGWHTIPPHRFISAHYPTVIHLAGLTNTRLNLGREVRHVPDLVVALDGPRSFEDPLLGRRGLQWEWNRKGG